MSGRPSAAHPSAAQPVTGQATAGQPETDQAPGRPPGSAPPPGGWFEPGWGRQGQPAGPYPPGEPGAGSYDRGQPGNVPNGPGQYGTGQYGASHYGAGPRADDSYGSGPYLTDQHGGGQRERGLPGGGGQPANGVAVLTRGQPPAPAGPPASVQPPAPGQPETAGRRTGGAWPDICDQFGLHLLVLAEQLRASLDELESDEADPERLRRLYQVDHAVTRMRRASRDLRTLAGRSEEELAGFTTSLLDVIRMAVSAIERYTQVTIGRVTDLAVLGYAADDIGSVLAALLDNATRYSPGTVSVSGHLLDDGGVMFRIEDTGIGMGGDQVAALNAAFAGPVPDVDERTGRHTGFPVVHRIARKHSVGVRLAARPLPSSGTVAMVTLPPHLLCEVPADDAQRRKPTAPPGSPAGPAPTPPRPIPVPDLPRGEPTRAHQVPQWEPPELPERDQARAAGDLPRRERASLRGDAPRPQPQEQAAAATPEQQAAARRAFADDLSAFSHGTADLPVVADDTATEEGAKP